MKKLEVRLTLAPRREQTVGTLAEDRGRVYFEYASEYLRTGCSLSPFKLPFRAELTEHRDLRFGPLPGLFDDSLPDGWGLLLMDRHLRRLGQDPAAISPLERLAWLGTRTMGALTYHPPADPAGTDESVLDLHDLARQAQGILSGETVEVLPQLLRAGGSPAGARPKVLVGYDAATDRIISGETELPPGFEHWLVKFASGQDGAEAGGLEQAYAVMARAAGLVVADTRLFETRAGDRFFGTRRFDRSEQGLRIHVHTLGNLIHADFRTPSADYADLLKVTLLLTRNHQDVLRAFRQAVFNVATHNRDDHVKNFAFSLDPDTGQWSLSPAYDLTFAPGPGGEHSTTVAGEGRNPGRPDLLRLAQRADLSKSTAAAIIDEVLAAVARWPHHAEEARLSCATTERIRETLRSRLT